ncbi:Rho GTPase activation protein [Coemansia reversa NRRL 1564]|uniref:Rho GTPase activation protein n=1 Tax=Coemansia reversa (strain ATCC 12441 / NRRL 1564) TaxID=763665 RepID=A0A2G5B9U8_COERN|nr:Rho GTPase activation protein [Coemansia reversa NRRL 1564]|eukprot:PIA15784.1 Rho GTPase activation protein [Coemansia reversa NRRL 1564]
MIQLINPVNRPEVHILVTSVVYIRMLEMEKVLQPSPHALVPGTWLPYIGVLAESAGYVSLFLFDIDRTQITVVAEVNVDILSAQDIRVVDNSLFEDTFAFSVNINPVAQHTENYKVAGAHNSNVTNDRLPYNPSQDLRRARKKSLPSALSANISGSNDPLNSTSPPCSFSTKRSCSAKGSTPAQNNHNCECQYMVGQPDTRPRSKTSGDTAIAATANKNTRQIKLGKNSTPVLFLATARASERNVWVEQLRQHAWTPLYTAPAVFSTALTSAATIDFRVERNLWIRILEAQGLATACDAAAMVVADGQVLAQTDVAVGSHSLQWDNAANCFGGLGPSKSGLYVALRQAEAGGLIGCCQIPIASLQRGRTYDGWYPLLYGDLSVIGENLDTYMQAAPSIAPAQKRGRGNHPAQSHGSTGAVSLPFRSGDIRIQMRYDETIVLDMAQYDHVAMLLLYSDPTLIVKIAVAMPESGDWLVENVAKVALSRGCAVSWISTLVRDELAAQGGRDPTLLFRNSSAATRAVDTVMKIVGLGFVDHLIGDVVRAVTEGAYECEVDPARLEDDTALDVHWRALTQLLHALWRGIENGLSSCPLLLHRILAAIRTATAEAYNTETAYQQVQYTCISGFVFLRLLCPAMLSPKAFGLVCRAPTAASLRTLTLLAKGLQCAANLSDFGAKEPYMQPMNKFVHQCIPRLKSFLDAIATIPAKQTHTKMTALRCYAVDGEHALAVLCAFIYGSHKRIRSALATKFYIDNLPSNCTSMPVTPPVRDINQRFSPVQPIPRQLPDNHSDFYPGPKTVPLSPASSSSAVSPPMEPLAQSSFEHLINECKAVQCCVDACINNNPDLITRVPSIPTGNSV